MSDVTTCRTCGLPRFHGPAGYAGAQCLCQWKGATLPQMYDELMAKNAALDAENARLTAQLAAIQGGMGEAEVEKQLQEWARDKFTYTGRYKGSVYGNTDWALARAIHTDLLAHYQRITAAMAAEVERLQFDVATLIEAKNGLVEECNSLHDDNAELRHERDALRAELAEVKGREAVPVAHRLLNCLGEVITEWKDGPPPDQITSACGVVQTDVVVESAYGLPPASPDVEGLVKALEKIAFRAECFAEEERDMPPHSCEVVAGIAEDALSTWRQAQEGKA